MPHYLVKLAALLVAVMHMAREGVYASPPRDLSNFQDNYVCNQKALIVRPQTIQDVQQAVQYHAHVKGAAEGWSWNGAFYCVNATAAPINHTSANIIMTTIRPLMIEVNETEESVTVDAGVRTIDLIRYLSNYVTQSAPMGWTLGAFPWFVYQSIGGAVSTGSHGSSIKWKSLSSQVLEVTMVLANGTLRTFTEQTDPFLIKAVRLSVGKLGVIAKLKMRIIRELPVRRTLRRLSASGYLASLREAQQTFVSTGSLPEWCSESEWFWITQRNEFWLVSYVRGDDPDPVLRSQVLREVVPDNTTVYNTSFALLQENNVTSIQDLPILRNATFDPSTGLATVAETVLHDFNESVINKPVNITPTFATLSKTNMMNMSNISARARGSHWVPPKPKPPMFIYASPATANGYMDMSRAGILTIAGNGTYEASKAYIYQPDNILEYIRDVPYDQYEVAFPVSSMADCWQGLLDMVYEGDIDGLNATLRAKDKGIRTAPLIRLAGGETGTLLSISQPEPHMYLNIEDYIYYNSGNKPNEKFRAIMAYLRSDPRCGKTGLHGGGGRLHWGKAGWPDPGCWHGDKEFPETWCDFGCAAKMLDPQHKFLDSAGDRWNWQGVDLDTCCGPDGFMRNQPGCKCEVQHKRPAEDCPPPPYYTNR